MKVAFIMTGPHGGQILEMDDKDLAQAEKEGWAMDFEAANTGGDPDPFRGHNTDPHPQAEAWLEKKGLYPTREMRAERPAPFKQPETDAPAKGKPGRPPKK